MAKRRTRNIHDDHGTSLIEYVLLVALLAVMGVTSLNAVGAGMSATFSKAALVAAGGEMTKDTLNGTDPCLDLNGKPGMCPIE